VFYVDTATSEGDPEIALARPPVGACGGGVDWVNSDRLMPPIPRRMVSSRIQSSQKRPKAIAASDSDRAMALTRLRAACLAARATCAAVETVPFGAVLMIAPPRACRAWPAAASSRPAPRR